MQGRGRYERFAGAQAGLEPVKLERETGDVHEPALQQKRHFVGNVAFGQA